MKKTIVQKTGDFVVDVRAGFYRQARNGSEDYTFNQDFRAWLVARGVPKEYAGGVSRHAYESGHSAGEEEILNHAYSLIEILELKEST